MVINPEIQITDDFIPSMFLDDLLQNCLSNNFGWFWNDIVQEPNDPGQNRQFVHTFFDWPSHQFAGKVNSDFFPLLTPILEKLQINTLLKAKINLNPRAETIHEHGFHTDIQEPDILTAIFYVNTNNGYTAFRDGSRIESVANRVIVFDSLTEHTGTTCTDIDPRLVLNINYKK